MNKIEFWLLKYSALYKVGKDYQNQDFFDEGDIVDIKVPFLTLEADQNKFMELYRALDLISEFQKNENEISSILDNYNAVKDSDTLVCCWLEKNKHLGTEKYCSFLLDYLDYDDLDEEEYLLVYQDLTNGIEVFIDRHYFKNTIEFIEVFNDFVSSP